MTRQEMLTAIRAEHAQPVKNRDRSRSPKAKRQAVALRNARNAKYESRSF